MECYSYLEATGGYHGDFAGMQLIRFLQWANRVYFCESKEYRSFPSMSSINTIRLGLMVVGSHRRTTTTDVGKKVRWDTPHALSNLA
ncbi:hypothetical protein BDZ91DRAFT_726885 [Kalaharituber pfeilii]|nr:hypothetical protein BDZ91DRAFT_726885 [Kalaharituber pfeilii]